MPGEGDDLFVIELPFLDDFVIGSEHGEVAAAGAPGRVIGGDGFLGDFFADEFQHGGGFRRSCGGGVEPFGGCLVGFGAHFWFVSSPDTAIFAPSARSPGGCLE